MSVGTASNTRPDALEFSGVGTGVDAMLGTPLSAGRRDGRSPSEMRSLSISHGPLVAADGSARVRLGATDVVVAVYGPMGCPVPRQDADQMHVSVAFRRRAGTTSGGAGGKGDSINAGKEAIAGRDLKKVVEEIVMATLHPRKAAVVAVQVLADNGGVIAAAINGTVMALVDAGMPMRAVPSAASVSLYNGAIVVDPVLIEEVEADGVITFVFDTSLADENGFMSVYTDGDCTGDSMFAAALEISRDLALKTMAFLKLSLEQKAAQRLTWNTTKT